MRQELIAFALAVGQVSGAPAPVDFDEVFRNLVAEETKHEQLFDQSGAIKKQRKIVSDLLVYQSSHDVTETCAGACGSTSRRPSCAAIDGS